MPPAAIMGDRRALSMRHYSGTVAAMKSADTGVVRENDRLRSPLHRGGFLNIESPSNEGFSP
jgi:hypothetical protein